MNLISLLDGHSFPKLVVYKQLQPSSVVIFHTDTDAVIEHQQEFHDWIADRNIPVRSIRIDESDMSGMNHIFSTHFQELSPDDTLIDLTGAGPVMVIAATQAAESYHIRTVCLDDDTNTLIYMPDGEKQRISVKMDIEEIFESSGRRIITARDRFEKASRPQMELSYFVGKNYSHLRKLLRRINGWYQDPNMAIIRFHLGQSLDQPLVTFVNHCHELGYIQYLSFTPHMVCFLPSPDSDHRKFFCGSWLEWYVVQMAKRCKPDDLLMGVQLQWDEDDDASSKYEIDVAYIKNDRLIFVECKSGGRIIEGGNEIIYHLHRLSTLRSYFGGLYAEAILVLAGEVPKRSRIWKRSEELDIPIFDYNDLERLDEFLVRFTPGGRTT